MSFGFKKKPVATTNTNPKANNHIENLTASNSTFLHDSNGNNSEF